MSEPVSNADELDRLRAELARVTTENARLTADFVDREVKAQALAGISIVLSQRTAELARVTAERDALLSRADPDPLSQMWLELEAYQPQADADGHGESWRVMCRERTAAAAEAAGDASSAARAAAWAAATAAWAAADAADAAARAEDAIAAICRAKEGKR